MINISKKFIGSISMKALGVLVDNYSQRKSTIYVGQWVGNIVITKVGSHTIQYDQDGWSGSIQIPFVDSEGAPTAHYIDILEKEYADTLDWGDLGKEMWDRWRK